MKNPLAIQTLMLTAYCLLQTANMYSQIITTVAGNGVASFGGDGGQATVAKLYYPTSVTFDAVGNMYIADSHNERVRMVNTSGIISTIAGNGGTGYSGNGGPATAASFENPIAITLDASGNLYIADWLNNVIRMVNTSGIITTFAGDTGPSYGGDGGPATSAELYHPSCVNFDATGSLYIADYMNNRVRKVNTSGIITTIAGNGSTSYGGDGGLAASAGVPYPNGITFDTFGNLYITDYSSRIRKVNTSGTITTVAGNGTTGFSGDGGPATAAQISIASGLVFDDAGNMFIADVNNNRIRKVDISGIITTIVGNGTGGFNGDGGLATTAELNSPEGLAFDAVGNLYIADVLNNRIRMVTNVGTMSVNQVTDKTEQVVIWPNPASNNIQVSFSGSIGQATQLQITDVLGNIVKQQNITTEKTSIDVSDLTAGVYFAQVKTNEGTATKKIVVQR